MLGNLFSNPTDPVFLLDESLAPPVAKALRLVGYNFVDVGTVFGTKGIDDPEIIAWCRQHEAVWVHADDSAKREHGALLQSRGIKTLWIRRRKGKMSGKEQLRILSFALPRLFQNWENNPRVRHYQASSTGPLSKITLRKFKI